MWNIITQLKKEGVVGFNRQRLPWNQVFALEPQASHEVDHPRAASRLCYSTERGRVERLVGVRSESEVWIVQNIDERGLYFKADTFTNRESLGSAHIKVEVSPAVHAVQREVTKRSGCWLSQYAGFDGCGSHLTS